MSGIIKAVTSIFQPAAAPKLPRVLSMPDHQSTAAKVAARRKVESRRKEGRSGTIYTSGSGGAYSGANLAGTQ